MNLTTDAAELAWREHVACNDDRSGFDSAGWDLDSKGLPKRHNRVGPHDEQLITKYIRLLGMLKSEWTPHMMCVSITSVQVLAPLTYVCRVPDSVHKYHPSNQREPRKALFGDARSIFET